MSGPLVTIVTPSLNQGRFIRATIESVLAQDYSAIEYFVMDGGSSDETASVAAEYGSRLHWISEADLGQSNAINKGWKLGKGSILAWINSDDLLLPGAVRKAVEGLETAPAVYGDGTRIDESGNHLGRIPWTGPFDLRKLIRVEDYILQQSSYFRRETIEKAGFLREDLRYVMDWDLMIRVGREFGFHYIPEPMGAIREHPRAKSFSGGRQRIREIGDLMKEHAGTRYTPAYFIYALHAYKQMWGRPQGPRRIVEIACGGTADWIYARAKNRI